MQPYLRVRLLCLSLPLRGCAAASPGERVPLPLPLAVALRLTLTVTLTVPLPLAVPLALTVGLTLTRCCGLLRGARLAHGCLRGRGAALRDLGRQQHVRGGGVEVQGAQGAARFEDLDRHGAPRVLPAEHLDVRAGSGEGAQRTVAG